MKLKKAIKRIAAIGSGAVMLGATVLGAMAADLSDYPSPFLKDGELNTILVVGADAASSDVIGVTDIAASLQARMTTPVEGAAEVVTVTGESVLIQGTADDLNYGEGLNETDRELKKADLPTILADGTVTDESEDEDYDYTQEIQLSGDAVTFGSLNEEDYVANADKASDEIPVLYLNQDSGYAYKIVVDFDDTLNATALDDNEKIVIAGKELTFDPDMDAGDDELVLYASDVTQTIAVGETVTIGDDTIELVGANTDTDEATIKINDKAYQVEEGDTVAGDYYISEIFMQTVPTETASVEIFVGSDKIVIPEGTDQQVEVDGEDLEGVTATVSDIEAIDTITFTVTPSDMDDDEKNYLEIGEEFIDPLFGTFKLSFVSVDPALDSSSKDYIELSRSGDKLKITFTNRDGEAYSFTPYEGSYPDTNITKYADLFNLTGKYKGIEEDKIIILNEGTGDNAVTKIYEVYDIDASEDEVVFEDLSTGSKTTVQTNETLIDSPTIYVLNETGGTDIPSNGKITLCNVAAPCNVSNASKIIDVINVLQTKNDMNITLKDPSSGTATIEFDESADNIDEDSDVSEATDLEVTISSTDDNDVEIGSLTGTFDGGADNDNEVEYELTAFGTYMVLDKDDGSYLKIWVPEEENDYNVYVTELAATTTTSVAEGAVQVTPMSVGTSKLDTEVTDITAQNAIIVGGPCVNKAAAAALGLDYPACGAASTIPENQAIIKLVTHANGNVALVVAGWTADDTRRACSVVAQPDKYTLSGEEVTVSGTTLTDISVSTA